MTYDGETESMTTLCGGFISIIIQIIGMIYLVEQSYAMVTNEKGVEYSVSDHIIDTLSLKGRSMVEF